MSGEGAVTKILLKPNFNAAAKANPIDADLPLPLPAVIDTVAFDPFYTKTSINVIITFAWSKVFVLLIIWPIISLLYNDFFNCYNYYWAFLLMIAPVYIGLISLM